MNRLVRVLVLVAVAAAYLIFSTIEACRLPGASIIMTGLSHGIADVLVSFGVDLGRVTSLGDLQSGMEEAERLLATDGRGWAGLAWRAS